MSESKAAENFDTFASSSSKSAAVCFISTGSKQLLQEFTALTCQYNNETHDSDFLVGHMCI